MSKESETKQPVEAVEYEEGQDPKAVDAAVDAADWPDTIKIAEIARACHEVNRAYCASMRDFTHPKWDDCAEAHKASIINGVKLHLKDPKAGPGAGHKAWMQGKLDGGWHYATVKNLETKEHPCLVPFSYLPKEQQAKDYIFRAVVHALSGIEDTYT
jgi:hypothetical protein